MSRNYDNFADLITFSRASQSTVVDSDGTLKYAAHNLVTYSEDFSQWSKTNTTVTTNNVTAPDGTSTADSMTIVNNLSRVEAALSLAADTYTFEVWLKSDDDINQLRLLSQDDSGTNYVTLINITGGAGWVKFTATHTYADTLTKYQIRGSSGTTDALHVWGAHLYKSDKPMQNNPAQSDANLATYVPTTSAAVYQPRIDFDPVTGDRKGLLIEEARTNLVDESEDLTGWSLTATTVTANQAVAPDGKTTADEVSHTSSTAQLLYQVGSGITAVDYTASVYVKYVDHQWVRLFADTGSAWFDIQNGVIGTEESGVTALMQDAGDGWYRISVTKTASASSYNLIFLLAAFDGSTTESSGTSAYFWGAQIEVGSFPTSYIPTSGSTVTRSADVASIATSAFGFNEDEGTFFVEGETSDDAGSLKVFAYLSENGYFFTDRIYLSSSVSETMKMNVESNNVETASIVSGSGVEIGKYVKLAGAYQKDNFGFITSEGALSTDTSGDVPREIAMKNLSIGNNPFNTTNMLNGHIKKLQYFPRRLSDTELQEITS